MAEEEEKKKKCPAGAPLWMCTFADMMSLLLCFFVLLLSFSNQDKVSFAKMAGSMKDAFGSQKTEDNFPSTGEQMISPDFKAVPINVREEIQEAVAEMEAAGMIESAETSEGLVVRVKEQLAFDSGRAEIKPEFILLLDKIGKTIARAESVVVVNGHTDDIAVSGGQFRSNWGLSTARAVAVVEHWTRTLKIPPGRLSAAGYADGRPIANNTTPDGRARNRRVEFIIKPVEGANQAFSGISRIKTP